MRLDEHTCRRLAADAPFGVLGTSNADGSTHLVPVVFAVIGSSVVVPVDRVKPKRSTQLRRTENLEERRRATLLVDHRSDDWDRLWWVRIDLTHAPEPPVGALEALAVKYPPYRDPDTIAHLTGLSIAGISGWAASGSAVGR